MPNPTEMGEIAVTPDATTPIASGTGTDSN
ncbi:hypothetical protein SAMN05444004_1017 [Jannaschia faecimaris]|uniref:Uncharacterized protein n=1 Tax=Jannaschia faecimaris TaxID=1244108 RepID=A0A1H3IH68_9RHOB|nr:hypothetical protein SAMN05444004_1017 [Jannaschia faecimaris]